MSKIKGKDQGSLSEIQQDRPKERSQDSPQGGAQARPQKNRQVPLQLRKRHRQPLRLRMKRKKTYRESLQGDSISKGIIWDEDAGKYKVLPENYAELVNRRLRGNLLNRARFGMTLSRAMTKSIRDLDDVQAGEKPDLVLIEYGGNDCDFDWEAIARDPTGNHDPKTNLAQFKELLKTLLLRFSGERVLPVLMTLPPLDADRYFAWVSQASPDAAANILAWLGTVSRIYWWQERYNAAILDVAARMGVHVLDVRSAFLGEADYREYLCMDGIHPNASGHRLMADCVSDWLERFCGRMMLEAEVGKSSDNAEVDVL